MRSTRSLAAVIALALLAVPLAGCGGAGGPGGPDGRSAAGAPGADPDAGVAAMVRRMTPEEKVGQLFVPVFEGTDAAAGTDLIKKYHLGGVIYFPGNLRTPRQTAELSNALQKAARRQRVPVPLVIGIDQEQGIVARLPYGTRFPGNMAQAATGRTGDVTAAARVTGSELRAIGVNTDYAPVVDVNVNPRNPVIGIRSFGSDPRLVSKMTGAAVDGFRAAGVAAVAKHFPGHGDTATDSHSGLPVIRHSRAEWERVDAPPFKAAIRHRVDAIMSAHIVVPRLGDAGVPATLSKPVLTGLLRDRLGFRGVVVTDALNMAGARKSFEPGDTAVRAVLAGADQLLMPPDLGTAYKAVLDAVRKGRIPARRLDESVTRILSMKSARGMFGGSYADPAKAGSAVGSAANLAAARRVAEHSITLVRHSGKMLPVRGKRVFVTGSSGSALAAALRKQGVQVVGAAGSADAVVVGTSSAGPETARQIAASAAGKPAVAVAFGAPYDLAHATGARAALAAYSSAAPSVEAVAAVLSGKVRPTGKLPVTIPKAERAEGYKTGHGLGL